MRTDECVLAAPLDGADNLASRLPEIPEDATPAVRDDILHRRICSRAGCLLITADLIGDADDPCCRAVTIDRIEAVVAEDCAWHGAPDMTSASPAPVAPIPATTTPPVVA